MLNPFNRRVRDRQGFPVFHGSYPLLGHMPAMMNDALGVMRRAEKEVGPFFWMRSAFGGHSLYCLLPESFTIFKNKVTTSTYLQTLLPEFFGTSVIAQDGPVHHRMRSAMNGPFLPPGLTAAETGATLADLIERAVRRWRDQGEVRVLAETRELVLAGIFRILGVPEADLHTWRVHYERFMLLALNLPGPTKSRGLRARTWLNENLMKFVHEAREHPDTPGLLSALVHARSEDGSLLSDTELLDNLRLLVLAGHETSASTMAWMVIKLAQRPEVWDRLCAEAASVGAVPRLPKELKSFPYAEAVFRESLRMHPPVSTDARRAIVDFEMGGRRVPAGTQCSVSVIYLSRHPEVYKDPDEFQPERWLGRNEAISPLELVQFGGGPHFCLGYHLAWMEIVQFAVALALAMKERGLRPRIVGAAPKPRYLPLLHPSARTRVAFTEK